jgi:polyribonucleotide nucleotidyltransferase
VAPSDLSDFYPQLARIRSAAPGIAGVVARCAERVGQVTDVMQIGDEVEVQVVGIEPDSGKIRLSRKPLLPPPTEEEMAAAAARPPRHSGPRSHEGDRGPRFNSDSGARQASDAGMPPKSGGDEGGNS